jgi:hypothetical protein
VSDAWRAADGSWHDLRPLANLWLRLGRVFCSMSVVKISLRSLGPSS